MTRAAPLEGVKVLEAATLFAGPLAVTFLGDFGADVTKIEHPLRPDAARGHGASKDGVGLWFKTLGRNKRLVTLDLSSGREVFLDLVRANDVLVENFRPGTLERWGLGPDVLLEANPRLVIARVTAFGQLGPWSDRPGFGSLAEAMSGFAAVTGERRAVPGRGDARLREGRGRGRTSARRTGDHDRSAVCRAGHDRRSGRRGARTGADAERAVPALRVARLDPLGRPPARRRHRRRTGRGGRHPGALAALREAGVV
jgi:hypothetical protein